MLDRLKHLAGTTPVRGAHTTRAKAADSTTRSPAGTPVSRSAAPQPADFCDIARKFFHDRVDCRPATLAAASKDFGHGVERLPAGVLFAKTSADIRQAVFFARLHGLTIAMRGQGHSAYGQTQAAGGLVIDTRNMQSLRWAGEDCIDAGPGANWLDVAKLALARGLTPPVMPDTSICLTVGGTLSVGGWGETSHRFGGQVDHIAELEVVTGTGERLVCSPDKHRELFDAVRAGMGEVGIITRARLKMTKAPASASTQTVTVRDAADFIATLRARAGEGDNAIVGTLSRTPQGFAPTVTTTRFDVERPGEQKRTFWQYLDRGTQSYLDGVKSGDILRPHPYLSFFVPEQLATQVIDRLLREPELTFGADRVVVFPYERARFQAPLFALPEGAQGFHMRIYRKAIVGDVEGHKRMLATNDRMMTELVAAGATVYLPHAPIPTPTELETMYGRERLATLAAAKRRFDPSGMLSPHALPLPA